MIFRRGIAVLTVVAGLSIALNLFLAGHMAGHEFRGPPPPFILEERLDGMLSNLPDKDKATVRAIIDRHREDLLQKWQTLRAENHAVGEVIKSDQFSPEQAQAAFEKSDQSFVAFRDAVRGTAIEIASQISPEGRKKLHIPGAGF